MFPIPMLLLSLGSGGIVPLPEGIVKKVVSVQYSSTGIRSSIGILLKDGRFFTQGANDHGELADGTTLSNFNTFNLAGTNMVDVWNGDRVFIAKFTDNSFKFVGNRSGINASGGATTAWTDLPTTITSTVDFSLLKEISGSNGNTIYHLTDGRLYGSGVNANGCLGSGNTNTFSTPRLIASDVKKAQGFWASVSYLSTSGILRVSGTTWGTLGTGGASQTTTFIAANLSTTGETVFIRDYVTTSFQTIVLGSPSGSSVDYLYSRGITASAYSKMPQYSSGFTIGGFFPGTSASHFYVGSDFLGIGSSNEGILGAGITNKTTIPVTPVYPFNDEGTWDPSLISSMAYAHRDASNQLSTGAMFMVYNSNLFMTGFSEINQRGYNGNVFVNINQFNT